MTEIQPIFRFAPSPNGELHLGHAYSALLNLKLAREAGGKMLLRVEDIDTERCTPELESQMLRDLEWIGFEWDEPPQRQSENFESYQQALDQLQIKKLLYPTSRSRREIRELIAAKEAEGSNWPFDPDGSPHYPGKERNLSGAEWQAIMKTKKPYALRLSMNKAVEITGNDLLWYEFDGNDRSAVRADPAKWGDVVLARKDSPASYHLSSVVDDAAQRITHVVRGKDLFQATSVHRVLQELLGLPSPVYLHHKLVLDKNGNKLAKSIRSTGLRHLREAGHTPLEIKIMVGID